MTAHTVTPAKRGRKPGSRNLNSRFDRDRCLDILHEVSARPENESLTVYQVLDEAAREVITVMLERKPDDEDFRATALQSVRKQLERDQAENDDRYFTAVSDTHDDYERELELYDKQDPTDPPGAPPPTSWEELLDEYIKNSQEDFRTLRQGFIKSAMRANAVIIEKRHPVKKRRLKQRDQDYSP